MACQSLFSTAALTVDSSAALRCGDARRYFLARVSVTFVPAGRLRPLGGEEASTVPGLRLDLRVLVLPSAQFARGRALRAAVSVRPASDGTMHAFAATAGADSTAMAPPGPVAVTWHWSALPASVAVRV